MAKAIDTLSIKLEFKAGSGSQQIIDKIGNSIKKLQVTAGQTGPSIDKVRRSVNDFAKQGNRSISTIEGQVTALRALRREADINSKEFKQLTADIGKYEKQLNKAQGRRGGGGARQATQVAGAVISGGIFGGPEGAIGGALGAFGGVQGAFAGAAIGAQVGGIRKSIGAAADYASQIGKLKIALEGVTRTTDEYTSALATAARITEELNVPQEDAVRGITRLSAAVKGAGGPITDAETTFRNVTAAIKATGGSTEDVKGAITAMVQVFSKGKVSAEELSGQLGERLPGAVTLFAKANKMTLPELQKNLKAGTVGLNELMKFIQQLGIEFDGTAKKIANSNEEAGARLSVTIRDMQADIGASLVPIGAQFQDAFSEFIKTITPFLRESLPIIGNLFLGVAKNLDTLAVAAASAIAALSVIKIVAIVTAIKSLSVAKITLLRNVVLLKKGIMALNLTLLANPFVALAAGAALLATKLFLASKEQKRLNLLIREGSSESVKAEISSLRSERATLEPTAYSGQTVTIQGETRDTTAVAAAKARLAEIKRAESGLTERLRTAEIDATQGAALDPSVFRPFDYGAPTAESGTGGTGGTGTDKTQARIGRADEIVRRLQDQLRIQESQGKIGQVIAKQAKERSDLEARFQALLKAGDNDEITRAQTEATRLLTKKQALELEKRTTEVIEKATKPLEDITKSIQEKVRADKEYARLISEGINPELAKQFVANTKQFNISRDILDVKIVEAQAAVDTATAEERTTQAYKDQLKALEDLKRAREGLPEKKKEADTAANDSGLGEAESEFKQFQDTFTKGLDDMMNVGPKLAGVAVGAIGTMTDGLIELITTGKADFKAMAASILKDIAKIMLQAAIAGAVKKMFFADGGVIQGGRSVKPYATGGVVSTPTIFPMAGGDVGLMGEAGPEAIMPLKRGPGGRLGVEVANQNSPREAMSRYSRGSGGGGVVPSDGGSSASGDGGVAVAAPIDVRYTVERINDVNYVTADQFQSGMQRAASQGAQRGEQNTLKRLQMSGSTRKRLGL